MGCPRMAAVSVKKSITSTKLSWPAPILKVERHISDGFCAILSCSVNRYSDHRGSN